MSGTADDPKLWPATVRAMGMRVYDELDSFADDCDCACPESMVTHYEASWMDYHHLADEPGVDGTINWEVGAGRLSSTRNGQTANRQGAVDYLEANYKGSDVW